MARIKYFGSNPEGQGDEDEVTPVQFSSNQHSATPASEQQTRKRKQPTSYILSGLDLSNIIPVESPLHTEHEQEDDDGNSSPFHDAPHPKRHATRAAVYGPVPANYDQKYHIMDDVIQPARAKRHYDKFPDCRPDRLSTPIVTESEIDESSELDTSADEALSRRRSRRSTRNKHPLYNTKVHSADPFLKELIAAQLKHPKGRSKRTQNKGASSIASPPMDGEHHTAPIIDVSSDDSTTSGETDRSREPSESEASEWESRSPWKDGQNRGRQLRVASTEIENADKELELATSSSLGTGFGSQASSPSHAVGDDLPDGLAHSEAADDTTRSVANHAISSLPHSHNPTAPAADQCPSDLFSSQPSIWLRKVTQNRAHGDMQGIEIQVHEDDYILHQTATRSFDRTIELDDPKENRDPDESTTRSPGLGLREDALETAPGSTILPTQIGIIADGPRTLGAQTLGDGDSQNRTYVAPSDLMVSSSTVRGLSTSRNKSPDIFSQLEISLSEQPVAFSNPSASNPDVMGLPADLLKFSPRKLVSQCEKPYGYLQSQNQQRPANTNDSAQLGTNVKSIQTVSDHQPVHVTTSRNASDEPSDLPQLKSMNTPAKHVTNLGGEKTLMQGTRMDRFRAIAVSKS